MVVLAVLLLLFGVGSVVPAGADTVAMFVIVPLTPAVPVKVRVMLPPLGNVGIDSVPACKAATVGLAGQTAPPEADEHTKPVAAKFATTPSPTVAPLAADGPLLVITKLYVTLPFAFTEVVPDLTICKSATGVMVVVAVLVLLFGFESVTPAGAVTVAMLVIVPEAPAVPVKVSVMLPPLGNVGIASVPACKAATVGPAGQTAPPEALLHVKVLAVNLATDGSLTVALLAAKGPLLVTTKV